MSTAQRIGASLSPVFALGSHNYRADFQVGLAKACSPALSVPKGAVYLYSLSWVVSTLLAAATYWVLNKVSPMAISEDERGILFGVEGHVIDGADSDDGEGKGSKAFDG